MVLLTSCNDPKNDPIPDPEPKPEQKSISFSASELTFEAISSSALTQTVAIKATGAWEISTSNSDSNVSAPAWVLDISATKGTGDKTISITLATNEFSSSRSIYLYLKSKDDASLQPANLKITQKENPKGGLADYKNLGLGYDATGAYADQAYVKSKVLDWDKLSAKKLIAPVNSVFKAEQKSNTGKTTKEVQDKLSLEANVKAGMPAFSATVSSSFSTSMTTYKESEYALIMAYAKQQVVKLNDGLKSTDLQSCLTTEANDDINGTISADAVIAKYGTHVITGFAMGGVYQYSMSAISTSTTQGQSFGAKVELLVSGIGGGAGFDKVNEVKNSLKNYQSRTVTRGGNAVGISDNGDGYKSWLTSINPENYNLWVLIDFEGDNKLIPIWELAKDVARQEVLKTAVNNKFKYVAENPSQTSAMSKVKLTVTAFGHGCDNPRWNTVKADVSAAIGFNGSTKAPVQVARLIETENQHYKPFPINYLFSSPKGFELAKYEGYYIDMTFNANIYGNAPVTFNPKDCNIQYKDGNFYMYDGNYPKNTSEQKIVLGREYVVNNNNDSGNDKDKAKWWFKLELE